MWGYLIFTRFLKKFYKKFGLFKNSRNVIEKAVSILR